jgi:hypothetical protein
MPRRVGCLKYVIKNIKIHTVHSRLCVQINHGKIKNTDIATRRNLEIYA